MKQKYSLWKAIDSVARYTHQKRAFVRADQERKAFYEKKIENKETDMK